MSIDTRLRTGLRVEAELAPVVDVVDTWAEVMRRADRDTTRRRTRVAALAVAAVAAVALVVTVVARPSDEIRPAPSLPTPSPSSSSPTEKPAAASPLEGKWVAGPAPVQRVLDHLADEGYADLAATVLEGLQPGMRPGQTVIYSLILQDGQLVMGVGLDGGASDNVDYQSFDVRGERVAFIQQGTECETILRWTVTGDTLRLSLVDDPCADVEGTPDAAYVTALYSALPFARSS